MTASSEALGLVALVANGPKYRERLQELISKTEAANKASLDLQAAEKSSAEKLAVTEALHASLQTQVDELTERMQADLAKIEAAKGDLANRASQLELARQQHAEQVQAQLQTFAAREAELAARQSALDTDFHRRLEDLRGVENKLRDHHSGLRTIIAETRQGIAAVQ